MSISVLDRRVAVYQSLTSTNFKPITVAELAHYIQEGSYRKLTEWYSTLADTDKQRAKQYKAQKMPAYCPSGVYSRSRKERKMSECSGIIWVDFDDCDNAANVRHQISQVSNCVISYISVSGKGVHALFVTTQKVSDPETYGRLWDCIIRTYIPNNLRQFIDPASRRVAQLAIISTDPAIFVNENPVIPDITIPPKKPEPKLPYKFRTSLADEAKKNIAIYNLLDRTRPPSDYPTWIKLLASLKAGGISEGGANSWSQRGDNYTEKSFSRAWKSLSAYGGITIGTFLWWSQSQRR